MQKASLAMALLSLAAGTVSAQSLPWAAAGSDPSSLPGPLRLEAAPAAPGATADRRLFTDWTLVAKEYGFGVAGQAVAGALGFYIGSGIETAIVGDEDASKGWLSFTAIRYDNFKGAFWGAATGGLLGSALTTYFVGQTDEEDGSLIWTTLGAALAGAGGLWIATQMGVNEERDWKPFIPLLALPSAGGVLGFNVSRWFSDRKRERAVGPEETSFRWQPPRLALGPDGFALQAVGFTF